MKPLKQKWQEVVSYIPSSFTKKELKNFISYLIKDKTERRVYFKNGILYDKNCNVLQRRNLIFGDKNEGEFLKEIILSGAGEVQILAPLPPTDSKYLKEYFNTSVKYGTEN